MPASSPPPVLPDERPAADAARLTIRHTGRFTAATETVQRLLADSCLRPAEHTRVNTHE